MTTYDVIVLGIGGVGSSALYHLARRGLKVCGFERFQVGHDRGSSHGETRLIRKAYYEHPDYVPLMQRSYQLWSELEQESGQTLYRETGILQVGPSTGRLVPGVLASARQHGLAVETFTAAEASQRFPGFHVPDSLSAVFEPGAGFLYVDDCVQAHKKLAVAHGAELHENETILEWKPSGSGVTVVTDRGTYQAGSLIVSAGAWAGPLLRDIGVPLQVVRKSLYWYAASQAKFRADGGGPGFIFETPKGNFYGFPVINELGVKLAEHTGGHPIEDPLIVDRTEDPLETERVLDFLSTYMPDVTHEQKKFYTCLYTLSPDRDFLVDRHPQYPQVSFVAGLSGHGFKFTSVLGEVLADLSTQGQTAQPIGFLNCRRASLRTASS